MTDPSDATLAFDRALFGLRAAYADDDSVTVTPDPSGADAWIQVVFDYAGVGPISRTAREVIATFEAPVGFEVFDIDPGPDTTTVFIAQARPDR